MFSTIRGGGGMSDDLEAAMERVSEPIALRRFETRGILRVLMWGAAAAGAVAIVVGAASSESGAARLKQALASVMEPARAPEPPKVSMQQFAALEQQTQDLLKAVQTLTSDRTQLDRRLASLEHGIDDITGAIKRQTEAAAAREAARAAAPAPVVSTPAATAAITTPPPPAPQPPAAPSPAVDHATAAPATTTTPADVPLPPSRIASAAAAKPQVTGSIVREVGIDVGGAPTLDELHDHWTAIKANIGPDIAGLRPTYTVRHKPGGGVDYRLVLGPLPNTAAAQRVCAKLGASKVYCRPGYFNAAAVAKHE
jgi:hypothetical protein